jgi:hypothetical protein
MECAEVAQLDSALQRVGNNFRTLAAMMTWRAIDRGSNDTGAMLAQKGPTRRLEARLVGAEIETRVFPLFGNRK